MTVKSFYSQYWLPLVMTFVPMLLMSGFAAYLGVRVAITQINSRLEAAEKVHETLADEIKINDVKDEYQGETIFRLISNQERIGLITHVDLKYTFENLSVSRGGN